MKLQTKITLAATASMLFLSQIFSIWNISVTQSQIIDNILLFESEQLQSDINSFSNQLSTRNVHNSQGMQYAGQSVFRSGFSENAILYYEEEELDNRTPYIFDMKHAETLSSPYQSDVIPNDSPISVFLEELNGTKLLILYGSSDQFQLLHYRDVTSVFQSGRALLYQGILVACILSVILAAVLMLTIRRILTPFYQLRDAANVIADGDYQRRVDRPGSDEIGQVSQSFNRMADRVEEHIRTLAEMNEKQRQLLGSLAHELKTPMTGIQGYAELLQRVKLPLGKQSDFLHYIEEECRRLSRLSAKMLQLTELSDETVIEKTWQRVEGLFAQARQITRFRLQEKNIRLQIRQDQGLRIECDRDLLLSFLTNLIDNACKASPADSCIRLIGTGEGLFVQDEGCGIPEEEIRRVTEPFYMIDKSRSRKQGGAGLGLALCSQIARLHGGMLEIRSVPGEGSRIGIRVSAEGAGKMGCTSGQPDIRYSDHKSGPEGI